MEKNDLIKFTTYFAVIISLVILGLKIYGYFQTNSSSILASLSDSLADFLMSFANFIAAIYAMKPPDHEHRFGHGKAEDLASFMQSILLLIVSIFIIFNAISNIYMKKEVHDHEIGVYIMLISSALVILLISVQNYAIRHTDSKIIELDKMHYLTDLSMNFSVILALLGGGFVDLPFAKYLDSFLAIMIGIYIIFSVSKILLNAFNNLMDREFSEKEREKIVELLRNNEHLRGFHDLKTRVSGRNSFVQVHVVLDGNMVLKDCHIITEQIEKQISAIFKNCEVLIHQDPENANEKIQFSE